MFNIGAILVSIFAAICDVVRGMGNKIWTVPLLCIMAAEILMIPYILAFPAIWLTYAIGYGSPWGQVLDRRPIGTDIYGKPGDYERWQIGPLKRSNALALFYRGFMPSLWLAPFGYYQVSLAYGVAFLSPFLTTSWRKAEMSRSFIAFMIMALLSERAWL